MSGRRREARVELECVEIVHVHARGATTEPSRGRGDDGQPLSVGARARVGHGGAPDVRGEHRVGGERPVDSAVGVGVGGVGRLSLRAGFDSRALERRCRRRRLRKVLLEHLHHLPGFEVDDVDRAARADRDENLAVRGEEEEVRARDPSRGALLLAKGPLLVVAAGRHLEKTEAMRVADGDEFACERGERERRRGDEVSARIETMDAWTGRDVGRRRLCRASPSDRSVTLFDVKFVSPRETRSKHIVSSRDDAGPNGTRRARARRKEDVARVRVEYLRGGQSVYAERERERATLGARLGECVWTHRPARWQNRGSACSPQLGAQHVFRRRRQLHHAVVSLDGRERVRRGPSRPAPDPLTEPPHVQPPGVIAEQQRRRRRPRPRLRRPPRARLRPLFLSLRGCFRRHGPRSSACHRQRGALRHAHHPHGMPFTKSRRRVRQELRVVPPPESKMAPPACPLPPPPPADGGAAAIANARTSCVCGLFVPVKVHLSNPRSSGGTRSNAATCASTPEAKTTFPSGDAASARTSARCCL